MTVIILFSMKTIRIIATYLLCLPFNLLVGWPVVLFVRACWGENLRWERPPGLSVAPALTCDLKMDSWPTRTWYSEWNGTTLGHAIFYGAGIRTKGEWGRTQRHEHVHVEQFEGSMISHFILGSIVAAVRGLQGDTSGVVTGAYVWFAGYLIFLAGGWLAALVRDESIYESSAHEESARAIAEEQRKQGS